MLQNDEVTSITTDARLNLYYANVVCVSGNQMTLEQRKPSQVKDPYCMLPIAVVQRMARDAKKGNKKAKAWFESEDYHFYLDYISQSTGIELSYSLRPEI